MEVPNCDKMFATHIKGLLTRIYKEYLKINNRTNSTLRKWTEI